MTAALSRQAAAVALLALAFSTLPGCWVFIEDDDDDVIIVDEEPVYVNSAPVFDASDSWWQCDWSDQREDYWFEFQAHVDDFDGSWDVQYVDATVFLADDPDYMVDSFPLLHEDGPIWGGIVWEAESNLYCGEAIDVLFEAWDSDGAKVELLIRY